MTKKVQAALKTLKKAMARDADYARGWHANIAMACYDSIGDAMGHPARHKVSNEAASRFMKLAFGVETKAP